MSEKIYKIITEAEWQAVEAGGAYRGAAIDVADGYVHLSGANQVEETVEKHFRGQSGLLLLAFNTDDFDDALKWEPSRGGALFPHLYGELDLKKAVGRYRLEDLDDGSHRFPEGWQ